MKMLNYAMLATALAFASLPLRASAAEPAADIRITEVVAKNTQSIRDEDGDRSDWFELHNSGTDSIDLGGLAVTDDANDLTKWKLPNRILMAGEFVVVFASAKDRRPTRDGELHTNFKLSSDGEYLAIVKAADKQVLHAINPPFPKLYPGQSRGLRFREARLDDESNESIASFDEPTPGKPNGDVAKPRIAKTTVSEKRGFYDEPITVALATSTPDTEIRYTTDGSLPGPDNGAAYTKPLEIKTTTVLRAAAFKDGHRPSDATTSSYLFARDVANQPAEPQGWPTHYHKKEWSWRGRRRPDVNDGDEGMKVDYAMTPPKKIDASTDDVVAALTSIPTLSLVTDQSNFFDEKKGIFQNSEERGRPSERPTSVELIDPTGSESGFQINAGVRIRGGHSRQHHCQKHSMRLYFRSEYGESKLEYPLFGDEGVGEFDDIDLRTAQNYSFHMSGEGDQNTMIREVFSRDSQAALGQPYARSRYYHLYINGLYWGIYQTQEHVEAAYASKYFGGDPSEFDAIKSRAGHGGLPTDGNADGWHILWETAGDIAAAESEKEKNRLYQELQGLNPDGTSNPDLPVYLDADNLIDYMLVIFLTGNFDGPITNFAGNRASNNWFSLWKRNGRDGFQFFCHDSEHTLGGMRQFVKINRVGPFPAGEELRQSNPQWIHQQLLACERYRKQFRKRAEETLIGNGPLSLERNLIRVRHRAQDVGPAFLAEIARWGDVHGRSWKKSHWDEAILRVEDVLRIRSNLVPQQLARAKRYEHGMAFDRTVSAPLFDPVPFPQFEVNDSGKGSFTLVGGGKIFYTTDGSDPMGEDNQPNPAAKQARPDHTSATVFMDKTSPVRVHIPEDGSLGKKWIATDFDDESWIEGKGGVGYDIRRDYHRFINVDIQQQMQNKRTSAYVRYRLNIEKVPEEVDRVVLRLKCEDGIVAYLNGKPLARRNSVRDPIWNSQATASLADPEAIAGIDFDITEHQHLFKKGENVLAFQLMNEHTGSSDMLLLPEIRFITFTPGTQIALDDESQITVRVLESGNWGRKFQVPYAASTVPSATSRNVVLSEVMYHPTKPTKEEEQAGFKKASDFEYIEFKNVRDEATELAGVYCREGIYFLIDSSTIIEPGKHCVLASNPAAFAMRYSRRSEGEFRGQLRNEGERITIRDAQGSPLAQLAYSNESPWPEKAAGEGASLSLTPSALADQNRKLGAAESWTASETENGSPGRD